MKKYFLLIPLILFLVHGFAQSISVSNDIQLKNEAAYYLIGKMRENYLLFRDRTTEFEVQGFNNRLEEGWTKEIELDKRLPKVLHVEGYNDAFYVFYRFRDKSNTVLKAHKYDGGANLRDSTVIRDLGYLFYTPDVKWVRSEDRSKFLFFFFDRQRIFRAIAFDVNDMKFLWDKVIEPADFDYYRDFVQATIDNAGNGYLVVMRDNFKSRRNKHHYEVFQYNWQTDRIVTAVVNMMGRLTFDVFFRYDKNPTRAIGTFYLNIPSSDPANRQLHFGLLNDTFVSSLEGEKSVGKGIENAEIKDIILRTDSGILMVAEKTKLLERRSAGASRIYYDARFVIDYYYDELFVISIHPTGQEHWATVLPKKQFSQDDGGIFSSFFLFKTPSKLRFIFNDEVKNENTVSEYVLGGTGAFDRNSVLSTSGLELKLRFQDAVQINGNELLIPSERRNRLKLVRLNY
ncbi:MAG: hypothetical protein NWR67_04690 [Saprospiraceae bacterium]|nr:hypothetical protein [Saprospiraceae bacterium]